MSPVVWTKLHLQVAKPRRAMGELCNASTLSFRLKSNDLDYFGVKTKVHCAA